MRDVQHIVSVSGGKDSTAVYLLALESGRPFRAVFADTGNEHEATYEYVARLPERTGGPVVETVRADFARQLAKHREYILTVWPTQGISEDVVRESAALNTPSGSPYLDLCIIKGRFPGRKAQFCTEELKELPIGLLVSRAVRDGPVLQWIGVRADESANRSKQPRYNRHETGSYVWRPIFRWTVEDVWAMHRKHGLEPNPLYALGMGRVGCMPCINCRKAELRAIADLFPEHIDRIERWERVVAAANKRRSATFFAPGKDAADQSAGGIYAGVRDVVEWARTARGGRQFDLFFQDQSGAGCSSSLALCEVADEAQREGNRPPQGSKRMSDESVGGPVDRDVGRDAREALAMIVAGPFWTETAKNIARLGIAEIDRLRAENEALTIERDAASLTSVERGETLIALRAERDALRYLLRVYVRARRGGEWHQSIEEKALALLTPNA